MLTTDQNDATCKRYRRRYIKYIPQRFRIYVRISNWDLGMVQGRIGDPFSRPSRSLRSGGPALSLLDWCHRRRGVAPMSEPVSPRA